MRFCEDYIAFLCIGHLFYCNIEKRNYYTLVVEASVLQHTDVSAPIELKQDVSAKP